MALPKATDPYESYTEQLVYFSARLSADPQTAGLAATVDDILQGLDAAFDELRAARRAEVRARALRDRQDAIGDEGVRKYKRRVDVYGQIEWVSKRLFPHGLRYAIAPRGRPQLERLDRLVKASDELLASPRLASHPEAAELGETLEKGKQLLTESSEQLRVLVESWEQQTGEVTRASDAFNFLRTDGVGKLGAVIGELRALLGGQREAAYAYTQPSRSSGGTKADEASEPEVTSD